MKIRFPDVSRPSQERPNQVRWHQTVGSAGELILWEEVHGEGKLQVLGPARRYQTRRRQDLWSKAPKATSRQWTGP
jgi:hypothetical protein